MNLFASYTSIDTFSSNALPDIASVVPLAKGSQQPAAPPQAGDAWTEDFIRALQAQHAQVREFLQARSERWRRMAARFTHQIEKLQEEVETLTAANDVLRAERSVQIAHIGRAEESEADASRILAALEEIEELKTRNAELQRQVRSAGAAPPPAKVAAVGGDWESQKRRLLAELESDDGQDAKSIDRRLEIEEVITRTDRILAEKDHEIDELKLLLSNQSNSLGSLAVGAAALDEMFSQDEIIREERERLQLAQDDLREKLRQAEIEHARERARLARREAEIEERLRAGETRNATAEADAEALAPTGRPIRGRWRTQLGLADDDPPNFERNRK